MLLEKDPKDRPSVAEILKMNIVKQKMAEFVAHKGQTLKAGEKVYIKETPQIVVPQHKP